MKIFLTKKSSLKRSNSKILKRSNTFLKELKNKQNKSIKNTKCPKSNYNNLKLIGLKGMKNNTNRKCRSKNGTIFLVIVNQRKNKWMKNKVDKEIQQEAKKMNNFKVVNKLMVFMNLIPMTNIVYMMILIPDIYIFSYSFILLYQSGRYINCKKI